MSGVTKHIYEQEIRAIHTEWSKQIKSIANVLPRYYGKNDIIDQVKKYYLVESKSGVRARRNLPKRPGQRRTQLVKGRERRHIMYWRKA